MQFAPSRLANIRYLSHGNSRHTLECIPYETSADHLMVELACPNTSRELQSTRLRCVVTRHNSLSPIHDALGTTERLVVERIKLRAIQMRKMKKLLVKSKQM